MGSYCKHGVYDADRCRDCEPLTPSEVEILRLRDVLIVIYDGYQVWHDDSLIQGIVKDALNKNEYPYLGGTDVY